MKVDGLTSRQWETLWALKSDGALSRETSTKNVVSNASASVLVDLGLARKAVRERWMHYWLTEEGVKWAS